eukprot:TRINITY_DN3341_c2_g1_i1.p1 TRINITY_DN3341_c2_g1~~TRINITY_DN3341_c2_g1_i1.p1  ORF type:complete len:830 (-),score=235.47 TRINITY_DN3341_c2_g1_i1:142-2604(-)
MTDCEDDDLLTKDIEEMNEVYTRLKEELGEREAEDANDPEYLYDRVVEDPRYLTFLFQWKPEVNSFSGGRQKGRIAFDPSHIPTFGICTKIYRMGKVHELHARLKTVRQAKAQGGEGVAGNAEELELMDTNMKGYIARHNAKAPLSLIAGLIPGMGALLFGIRKSIESVCVKTTISADRAKKSHELAKEEEQAMAAAQVSTDADETAVVEPRVLSEQELSLKGKKEALLDNFWSTKAFLMYLGLPRTDDALYQSFEEARLALKAMYGAKADDDLREMAPDRAMRKKMKKIESDPELMATVSIEDLGVSTLWFLWRAYQCWEVLYWDRMLNVGYNAMGDSQHLDLEIRAKHYRDLIQRNQEQDRHIIRLSKQRKYEWINFVMYNQVLRPHAIWDFAVIRGMNLSEESKWKYVEMMADVMMEEGMVYVYDNESNSLERIRQQHNDFVVPTCPDEKASDTCEDNGNEQEDEEERKGKEVSVDEEEEEKEKEGVEEVGVEVEGRKLTKKEIKGIKKVKKHKEEEVKRAQKATKKAEENRAKEDKAFVEAKRKEWEVEMNRLKGLSATERRAIKPQFKSYAVFLDPSKPMIHISRHFMLRMAKIIHDTSFSTYRKTHAFLKAKEDTIANFRKECVMGLLLMVGCEVNESRQMPDEEATEATFRMFNALLLDTTLLVMTEKPPPQPPVAVAALSKTDIGRPSFLNRSFTDPISRSFRSVTTSLSSLSVSSSQSEGGGDTESAEDATDVTDAATTAEVGTPKTKEADVDASAMEKYRCDLKLWEARRAVLESFFTRASFQFKERFETNLGETFGYTVYIRHGGAKLM